MSERAPHDTGRSVSELSRAEVRRRSLSGVFFLTSSSFISLITGFLASLVLARLLTPRDFGVVAIGWTAVLLANVVADGGLGAGMIRRAEPPTSQELRTINGVQLAMACTLCVPAIAVAVLVFGRTGAVTAVMIASLPIALLQTPGRVILAREMRYDRQLGVDFASQLSLQIFSVVAVLLGAGVWGLAFGQVVKALVGTAMVTALGTRLTTPSLRGCRSYGGLIRFGMGFQASSLTLVAREQGLNITLGAVGGLVPLGIWTFTNRIFQLPALAFNSLYVIGFPAVSNLLTRGEDATAVILRMARRSAIAGTFVFPVFAAASVQLIPVVFGSQWRDSVQIVPLICLSTMILGPITICATSYLSAVGTPGTVARASAALGVVWIGLSALLLPLIGIVAVGIGNLLGALVEAAILDRAVRHHAGVAPHRALLRPLSVGIVAGLAGLALAVGGPDRVITAFAAVGITLCVNVIGLSLVCRRDLRDVVEIAAEIIRSVLPRFGGELSDAAPPRAGA